MNPISTNASDSLVRWSRPVRILFRFIFAYLVLFNLFGGNSILRLLWDGIVPWVGRHVLRVEVLQLRSTGSGDTLWCYVQVYCFLALAAVAAAIWTLIDRKRQNYRRLNDWLIVILRYSLAMSMIIYGAAKVIPTQFTSPSPDNLLQTYGDGSPMRLLWTFMGSSAAYVIFTGVAEMLGGLLLTVRRTTLLGAMICIGVMSNVVMLNFCYDVPVKLLSSHLLAMSLLIVLPDVRRMADVFLFNRPVKPAELRPLFARPSLNTAAIVARTLFVASFTALHLLVSLLLYVADVAGRPPQYGVWSVEAFEVEGEVRPPLLSDTLRWRHVTFGKNYDLAAVLNPTSPAAGDGGERQIVGTLSIYRMNDEHTGYDFRLDNATQQLTLTSFNDPAEKILFTAKEPEPGVLVLDGRFEDRQIVVTLRQVSPSKFLLTSRGFHWISEFPFNI